MILQEEKNENTRVRIPLCPFPSLNWFKLAGKNPVVDIHDHYVKQTYRNRYDILGVNGLMTLTIPVEGQKGQKIPLNEIKLASGNWKKTQLAAIRSAYGRAAFFEYFFDDLQLVFDKKHEYLHDFSFDTISWSKKCGLQLPFDLSTEKAPFDPASPALLLEPFVEWPSLPPYPQVFSDRFPFISGLSIIDLLMNKGNQSNDYLRQVLGDSNTI